MTTKATTRTWGDILQSSFSDLVGQLGVCDQTSRHANKVKLPLSERFLADFRGIAPSDGLYVIHIGGDDLRDALVALAVHIGGTRLIDNTILSMKE